VQDRRLWRGAAVIVVLATTGFAIYFSPLSGMLQPAALLEKAREHQDAPWAIPAFFILYALFDLFFIPAQLLSVAATLMWGWVRGGFIDLLAATAGAIPPFLVARSALREPIARRLARYETITRIIEREGFTVLLILRVVPIVPYTVLNFAAGLMSIPLWQYTLASLLGMIPSAFIFAYFVEALAQGLAEPRDVVLRVIGAGFLLAALIIATRLVSPRVRRWIESRERRASPPGDADRD
jgi:uncharacterized membrane protein YdjX (TVP38/TMEM64 family)